MPQPHRPPPLALPDAPSRAGAPHPVFPIFLPYRGCLDRCVFCAQETQTGQAAGTRLATALADARQALRRRREDGGAPVELAFYGGTFTALPEKDFAACLALAREALGQGWATAVRCSTRPDRLDTTRLARLRAAGCATIELGVQSFSGAALSASRRGYGETDALAACGLVTQSGMRLGVQLLPGMPGHTPDAFRQDVALALAAGAELLRFYPCLVLEGTPLAALWRVGAYSPWPLETTLDALAAGWLAAARAGVPVIRMGLAPEPGLAKAVLAGPADPALGCRVMGRALLLAAQEGVAADPSRAPFDLRLPRRLQGCLWGWRGEWRAAWTALGLRQVRWEDGPPRLFPASLEA